MIANPMKKTIYILAFLVISALYSCGNHEEKYSDIDKERIDSIVYANRNIDSLSVLTKRFTEEGNTYGKTVSYRELGRAYRNASLFSEALEAHKLGFNAAVELCDTVQIIQALNNIGTVYRRMGILDEASSYHYQALTYCDTYSDKDSGTSIKNKVVSLNGIGNVQLSMGNTEVADSAFRLALKGESSLGSLVGQAINYANLGAILESTGQIDSARYFYSKSLECNKKAGSELGISLCHAHFGRLYENEGKLDSALVEYKKSYEVLSSSKDVWHWLESCLSLSRVNRNLGNTSASLDYLNKAKKAATRINSPEHLSDVYMQEYEVHKKRGNYAKALEAYVKSSELSRQAVREKNLTHIQNVRVEYEREKKKAEINLLQQNYESEKRVRNILLSTFVLILLLATAVIAFLIYIMYLRARNHKMMKELEVTRTNFFTNITHEFRTPLSVIVSAANDILKKNKTDKVIQRDTSDILRHSKGLLDLVNQVMDIAKMTSGASIKTPDWRHGDIIGFATMICESCSSFAASMKVNIVFGSDSDRIEMDFIPEYMVRTLQNLLSNAIKFSRPGTDVLVSIKKEATSAGSESMRLYVCDSGIGMDAKQKEDVFKPFYQAAGNNRHVGSGIGLSLVKLSVEAMKGKIEVHSHVDEGTVFIVTIPINKTHDQKPLIMQEYIDEPLIVEGNIEMTPDDEICSDADATRILIVEDTPEVARWQMRQLSPQYSFYFAADGKEGYDKAMEIVPDLIISDVMMPNIDGFELCRMIRSSELLCHIPFIMVTAKATQEDRLTGLEAGADAYMEKPFNADELSVRVEKLLEQRELLRRKFTDEIDGFLDKSDSSINLSDKAFVGKFSDEVNKVIREKIDYNQLASKFCLSRAQLNRKIKAITGYTTTEYILLIRVAIAKQLLVKTNLTIGEIAERCGVDDLPYFSQLFKKHVGKTPTQYRNR